jgi:hypothetical protein
MNIIMKSFIIFFIVLLAVNSATAEMNKKKSPKKNAVQKKDLDDPKYEAWLMAVVGLSASKWGLAFEHQKASDSPLSHIDVGEHFVQEAKNKTLEKQFVPYFESLNNLLLSLDKFGNERTYFLNEQNHIPFVIFNYNGKKTLAIYGLSLPTTYNTFKLTAKERASQTITSSIIPALIKFDKNFRNTDLESYMIFVTYGSKDFTNTEERKNTRDETLQIIIDKTDCKKFVENKITDQELIDKSIILLRDRDSNNFMRIKVSLK